MEAERATPVALSRRCERRLCAVSEQPGPCKVEARHAFDGVRKPSGERFIDIVPGKSELERHEVTIRRKSSLSRTVSPHAPIGSRAEGASLPSRVKDDENGENERER